MADRPLTLMAVHAHPDDEATSTGGILARYSAEGATTVLVTCTNGELGDAPEGMKPGARPDDDADASSNSAVELEESCAVLGVDPPRALGLPRLGDGRMAPERRPRGVLAGPMSPRPGRACAALMERYRPQVVVTYDEHGFYGHPDHIQANRVTHAAIEQCKIPDKLYYTAVPAL